MAKAKGLKEENIICEFLRSGCQTNFDRSEFPEGLYDRLLASTPSLFDVVGLAENYHFRA